MKLLYCKSKVYVHPTQSAKDNVDGWFALVQQKPAGETASSSSSKPKRTDLLLAWVPDSTLGADTRDTYTKVEATDSEGKQYPSVSLTLSLPRGQAQRQAC